MDSDADRLLNEVLQTNDEGDALHKVQIRQLQETTNQNRDDLQRQIDALLAQRASADERIQQCAEALSPIRVIPTDVLREIFRQCLPTKHYHVMSFSDAPLLLRLVNKHWKEVADSTPFLWCKLHLAVPSEKASELASFKESIQRWFDRSGSLPLSISFTSSPTYGAYFDLMPAPPRSRKSDNALKTLLSCIIPYVDRWKSLRFSPSLSPDNASYLAKRAAKAKSLSRVIITAARAQSIDSMKPLVCLPTIREVRLPFYHGMYWDDVHWENLTTLDISCLPSEAIEYCKRCPNLETLIFMWDMVEHHMDFAPAWQPVPNGGPGAQNWQAAAGWQGLAGAPAPAAGQAAQAGQPPGGGQGVPAAQAVPGAQGPAVAQGQPGWPANWQTALFGGIGVLGAQAGQAAPGGQGALGGQGAPGGQGVPAGAAGPAQGAPAGAGAAPGQSNPQLPNINLGQLGQMFPIPLGNPGGGPAGILMGAQYVTMGMGIPLHAHPHHMHDPNGTQTPRTDVEPIEPLTMEKLHTLRLHGKPPRNFVRALQLPALKTLAYFDIEPTKPDFAVRSLMPSQPLEIETFQVSTEKREQKDLLAWIREHPSIKRLVLHECSDPYASIAQDDLANLPPDVQDPGVPYFQDNFPRRDAGVDVALLDALRPVPVVNTPSNPSPADDPELAELDEMPLLPHMNEFEVYDCKSLPCDKLLSFLRSRLDPPASSGIVPLELVFMQFMAKVPKAEQEALEDLAAEWKGRAKLSFAFPVERTRKIGYSPHGGLSRNPLKRGAEELQYIDQ